MIVRALVYSPKKSAFWPWNFCIDFSSSVSSNLVAASSAWAMSAVTGPPILSDCSAELDFHYLGFFVLEMIVDGFDETISELLHFILNIAQAVLG